MARAASGAGSAYARALAPFGFSDGDGPAATSDAQNVDYGIGVNPAQHFRPSTAQRVTDQTEVLNGTPEDRTSLFGVVAYPFNVVEPKKQRPVTVAGRLQKGPGVGTTVGAVRGAPLGQRGRFWTPTDKVATPATLPGLLPQNEDSIYTTQVGQL